MTQPLHTPGGPAALLAVDTATPFLTLALCALTGDAPRFALAERPLTLVEEVGRGHAERLPGALQDLFARFGPASLRVLACGTGPGSYTGVRVGASLSMGLALASRAALVGIPTLEAIAAGQGDGLMAPALDARKGSVFSAVYSIRSGRVAETLQERAKRDLNDFTLSLPEGARLILDAPPDPLALARLALNRLAADPALDSPDAPLDLEYL
ncbi:MAG TPA: tRNA (adenosine(37)-N6)-threonylcarbamoyltransferase complex dimerization subunit type 1 TsaB [Deinococcales bacterium]|nr:tRNA (adenosine(37)-N6)-threonylcarbamoyltransferase complex dimerization subunit type 1 TsaB [Deinococcales bacterium]